MLTHTKITYVLFAVLFVALGFLLYQNEKLQMASHGRNSLSATALGGPTGATLPPNASSTAALADIIIGGGSTAPVSTNVVFGTITKVGPNSMQIKDQTTGGADSISITANTKVQLAGALKDQATQQKELAAYNAQVTTLMKDPIKNKAALAAMRIPLAQTVTPGTLSDLAVGDEVMVSASSITSGNVYVATLISKSTAAGSGQ